MHKTNPITIQSEIQIHVIAIWKYAAYACFSVEEVNCHFKRCMLKFIPPITLSSWGTQRYIIGGSPSPVHFYIKKYLYMFRGPLPSICSGGSRPVSKVSGNWSWIFKHKFSWGKVLGDRYVQSILFSICMVAFFVQFVIHLLLFLVYFSVQSTFI